ncbi:uncharacterized protein LOC129739333 [Uranotaenia lowii]|uniref:uncharacterized protein LOC129739333 n=1 Tax=Uranotaenia lowii TaxID=190385 RepID=UPI002479B077|nr:uncharacterized protein LOC129739333 [Uranotaenia lowii]
MSNQHWKRPSTIAFPSIWHSFKASDPYDGQPTTYRIQDLPPNRWDDAIDHMCEYFLRDEPICASLQLADDPVAVRELRAIWSKVVEQKCAVVCFKEDSEEIIALNMLNVVSKEFQEPIVLKSPTARVFVNSTLHMTAKGDLFNRYGVDHYLSAWGLSVHPKFRGLGLATEVIRTRIPLAKTFGLALSATVFSHPGSQIPAAKVGFQDEVVESFADLAKEGFPIEVNVEFNKLMTLKI